MKKTYKKFKVGALTLGAGVMSMFGGVACDMVHGAPIDTSVSASTYGLNAGWVFRGNGHHNVRVFTKSYPTGTAVVAFNNDGIFEADFFLRNNMGIGRFNATLLDPAIAHLFPNDICWILADLSFELINGVKNITFYGVHFVL